MMTVWCIGLFFFFKQKTAYEMRISDWSSDVCSSDLAAEDDEELDDAVLKLAIVGRPNAGKSTLINRILGEDRLITGPEAGITRDSIAIDWEWTDPEGKVRDVRLIATAGLRKRIGRGSWRERVGQ